MRIINSIDSCFKQQKYLNELLQTKFDRIMRNNIHEQWLYFSRLKPVESYILKIESGRVQNPNQLEDFFACCIVVENSDKINEAIEIIEKFCKIIRRKPHAQKTRKPPDVFRFDNLRIYAKLKDAHDVRTTELSSVIFEIQIKTFRSYPKCWS